MRSYAARKGPVALGSSLNGRYWGVESDCLDSSESDSAIRTESTESWVGFPNPPVSCPTEARWLPSDVSMATSCGIAWPVGLEMALEVMSSIYRSSANGYRPGRDSLDHALEPLHLWQQARRIARSRMPSILFAVGLDLALDSSYALIMELAKLLQRPNRPIVTSG